MTYFGIVNKIKPEHKSGIYGRKSILGIKNSQKISTTLRLRDRVTELYSNTRPIFDPITIINDTFNIINPPITLPPGKIVFRKELSTPQRLIIIENKSLSDDYSINDELFYGLFDRFGKNDSKKLAFEKIMKSGGGSTFTIIEKQSVTDEYKHMNAGHFSEGIYVSHPKNERILLPLNGIDEMIQSLIIEEIMAAYEALGAKSIEIDDIRNRNAGIGGGKDSFTVKAEANYTKKNLRKKKFGRGTFSPERALQDKYFIQDIPSVMATIKSRTNGNQTEESVIESINLSSNLDINVLKLFNARANYSYERTWSVKVEFYDKNEL